MQKGMISHAASLVCFRFFCKKLLALIAVVMAGLDPVIHVFAALKRRLFL
jgi:hypothetical protein